jgi:small subunit ribosomal protein S4
MEEELLARLKKLGILEETAVLDDVLDLAIEDILERRLHTIVFRRGLAKTVYQARQLITHGHIAIGDRRVTVPSYLVAKSEENEINYVSSSALSNLTHPLRQTIAPSPAPGSRQESQQPEEDE